MIEMPVDPRLARAVSSVCEEVGLPRIDTAGPAALGQLLRALEALSRSDQDMPVALLIARRIPLLTLGQLGLALRAGPDLRSAYARLARFHRVRAPFVELGFEPLSDGALLHLRYHLGQHPGHTIVAEGGLAMLVHLGRSVTGAGWSPRRVAFPHPVRSREHWEAFFGAPVTVGAVGQIELGTDVLALPTLTPDPLVVELVEEEASAALLHLPPNPLAAQLRRWLMDHLQDSPTASRAAKAMGMSRRSMHRRLAEADESFGALLERVRCAQASRLLAAGESVGDVALAMGYADTSSFGRAYRRWTNRSPTARGTSPEVPCTSARRR